MAKKRTKKSPLMVFRELEQNLCRVPHRVHRFRSPDYLRIPPERGHHAMAGIVFGMAYNALHITGRPTRKALGDTHGVHVNHFKTLFNGKPNPNENNWCRQCEGMLRTTLSEIIASTRADVTPNDTQTMEEIRERIMTFFFRDEEDPTRAAQGGVPKFFRPERREHEVPASMRELSHEIHWFGRQPEVGGFGTRLTVILGAFSFPTYDPDNFLLPALQAAVKGDAEVVFLVADPTRIPDPNRSVEQFLNSVPDRRNTVRRFGMFQDGLRDLADEGRRVAYPSSFGGAVPSGQLLHMTSVNKEAREETSVLYHLRYYSARHRPGESEPVVNLGTVGEVARMRDLAKQLAPLLGKPPGRDPTEQVTRTGADPGDRTHATEGS
jgi:hypothetical protein